MSKSAKAPEIVKSRILYEACPLCESEKTEIVKQGDCSKHPLYNSIISTYIAWKKCLSCGHIFTEGYFTDEAAAVIFSKTNEHQKVGADYERQRPVSARMIEKVLPFSQDGKWLDIGFGNGALLLTAKEFGFTPVGIDLRRDNVDVMKRLGVEAHCVDLQKFESPAAFNVISMADVLEHVAYPKDFLTSVHKLLADNGVVFISMPNSDSLLWDLLDIANANPYWGELEHFHNFGKERLYKLLRETGFEPVRYGISERYRACMEIIAKKTPV